MECSRCKEAHTGGFMLMMDPPVCVYCYYGIAVSSSKLKVKTRAHDRAEAEAQDEMWVHLKASGHRRIRSRVEGNKVIMECEECTMMVERKTV